MARPPRIDFPDAVYHVTSRGNGRQVIFWNDADRLRFLAQLADNLRVTAVVLYAYVLMDNHFHLLVRTPRGNLSRFMQRLLTAYALYARYKHRRPGHQLQGRFKAKLVEDDVYLRGVSRYMHLNPVKVAACRTLDRRERLRRLEGYRWSSYPGHVDAKRVEEFVSYDVLKEYGSDPAAARRQYRAYVQGCLLEDDGPMLEAMAASRYAIGDARFAERIEKRVERRRSGRAQDEDLDLPRWTVPLEEIDAAVAGRYRIRGEDLQTHGHHAGEAKVVAVELACRLTGLRNGPLAAITDGSLRRRCVPSIARCGSATTRPDRRWKPCEHSWWKNANGGKVHISSLTSVSGRYRIRGEDLRTHGHHAGEAKVVAVELACRLTGLTQRAIGRHYGRITSSAVCAIHRKVRFGDHAAGPAVEALLRQLADKRRRR